MQNRERSGGAVVYPEFPEDGPGSGYAVVIRNQGMEEAVSDSNMPDVIWVSNMDKYNRTWDCNDERYPHRYVRADNNALTKAAMEWKAARSGNIDLTRLANAEHGLVNALKEIEAST